jgi:hypothetical protein
MAMYRRRTLVIVPAVVVLTVVVLVFGVFAGSTIDGFTPGGIVKCSGGIESDPAILAAGCMGNPKRATEALDAREPGHPAIVSFETFTDGTQPGPVDFTGPGEPPAPAPRHPGPLVTVFVFKLADGSTRATGVACTKPPGGRSSCVGIGSYPN